MMYLFRQVLDPSDSAARAHQRMVFSGLSFLIVLFLSPSGTISSDPIMTFWMGLLVVHFLAALLQSWLLSNQEVHWEKIELPSYLLDLPLIGLGLAVAGEYLALFSPMLAVVALVRGIRHGPVILASHSALAGIVVLFLYWRVPFWGEQDTLVWANIFLLLILPVQFYGVSVKIQASSRQLHQENLTDPLTRCLNRKALDAALCRVLSIREPFVISFLDLDNFKMVNDTLGHATGDKLLRRMCAKLSLRLRVEDKVYRISGDEFVVVSVGTVRLELAESLGQRIQAAISEVVHYTCPELPISASVGVIVVTSFDEVNLEQLLVSADRLMYQAKKAGKNRVVVEQV